VPILIDLITRVRVLVQSIHTASKSSTVVRIGAFWEPNSQWALQLRGRFAICKTSISFLSFSSPPFLRKSLNQYLYTFFGSPVVTQFVCSFLPNIQYLGFFESIDTKGPLLHHFSKKYHIQRISFPSVSASALLGVGRKARLGTLTSMFVCRVLF
jgi:hypothetical protein